MSTTTDRTTTYECLECGNRVRTDERLEICERCGGDLRDIGRPRE